MTLLVYKTLASNTYKIHIFKNIYTVNPCAVLERTMAQKTIRSFFKLTPPKPARGSPATDGLTSPKPEVEKEEKPSSKRQRLDSSDSDSVSPKTPTQKKKRQRIYSSSSESQSPKKVAESPVKNESPNKTNVEVIKSELNASYVESTVKKENNVKKYESPKAKKQTAEKVLKESNRTSPKEKNSMKSFLTQVKKEPSEEEVEPKVEKKNEKPKEFFKLIKKENKEEKEGAEESKLVPEAEYNPGKAKYHPIKDACWSKGQEVPYIALARTLEVIEGTSARLKMIEILSNYFRSVIVLTPEDLLPSVYMCLNQLAPAYHSLELGIAETYLMKAVGQCTGRSLAHVRAAARRAGDLGAAAQAARDAQRTMFAAPHLRLRRVFQALQDIARMTGQASVNKKINKIQSLFVACRHSEAKYLIRSLEGKLRVGLAEQSALHALGLAAATTPPHKGGEILDASKDMTPEQFKSHVEAHVLAVKTAYCECPDYGRVVAALLAGGPAALAARCVLTPGVPLKPMLAHPTRGVHEIFNRFEGCEFTCEWKYDGERAQIHVPSIARHTTAPDTTPETKSDTAKDTTSETKPDTASDTTSETKPDSASDTASETKPDTASDTVPQLAPDLAHASVFSRNQENNTTKYPDIIRRLPSLLGPDVHSCVLDCEAVAYDVVNKQILPFQILSTRKRKDASEAEIKVQVCVFVFDLLFLNGRALVREPLHSRRQLLRTHFHEVEGEWQFATSKDCTSMEEVQQFLEEAVHGSCEGLMVKSLKGPTAYYDIARRSKNWLKLKKDYLEGVGDTIDAVVLGAYHGRGKRAGVYGGFLLACYDPAADEYQALCKIGTGFSDQQLAELAEKLKPHLIDAPRSYYRFDRSHAAEAWAEARVVLEVRCADLSLSPAHAAARGLVDAHKGVSLRFPRLVRIRDDKTGEQATTAQQIADMYLAQDQVKNQPKQAVDLDDFY
ncbi:DNA ligase 1 isoform X2 [Manduca sexta]|uniref:DNA ligase 1 isoform X2 n=1 Tax=Manduca sexta TaxID=7130 RepID=UPI00188EBD12|nr:DNA ligase 1 isoform X2 [Manduca sexta]